MDPMFMAGAGLLSGAQGSYGNAGAALGNAMPSIMRGLIAQREQKAIEEARRRQEEQARIEAEQARIEAEQKQAAMSQLMQQYPEYAALFGAGYGDKIAGLLGPQKPTSAQQNYEYLRAMGLSESDALDRVFKAPGGVTIDMGQMFGSRPPGSIMVDEGTPQVRYQYLKGSEKEMEMSSHMRELEKAIRETEMLANNIEQFGGEVFGEKAGEMASQYGKAQTMERLAAGMGAPQAAELAILSQQMPDPKEWKNAMPGWEKVFKDRARGAYNNMLRVAKEALEWSRTRYGQTVYGADSKDPIGDLKQKYPGVE